MSFSDRWSVTGTGRAGTTLTTDDNLIVMAKHFWMKLEQTLADRASTINFLATTQASWVHRSPLPWPYENWHEPRYVQELDLEMQLTTEGRIVSWIRFDRDASFYRNSSANGMGAGKRKNNL